MAGQSCLRAVQNQCQVACNSVALPKQIRLKDGISEIDVGTVSVFRCGVIRLSDKEDEA